MNPLQQCIFYLLLLQFTTYDVIAATGANITQHSNWHLVENDRCGNSIADRIIGGKNAGIGWYPWIARIGYTRPNQNRKGKIDYRCGGSLINDLYVVTAAHCVANLPFSIEVGGIRLGEHNTRTNPDCEDGYCAEPVQDFKAASIITHKDYDRPPFQNDIALVRLDKPAKFTEFVTPICLPRDDLITMSYVGKIVEVAGWGIYDIGKKDLSTVLQTLKLPVVEISKCEKAFGKSAHIGNTQLCVGGILGEDSCGGDSGGPMMKVEALDGPPKYFLLGIVSFGIEKCGSAAVPAVYTKVSHYVRWILDNIKS